MSIRTRLHEVIFEADTGAGKAFDTSLIVVILASVVVVMLDSVSGVHEVHQETLYRLEWLFTILFTIEYAARMVAVRQPWKYALSTFGIIDLLAILPTYVALLAGGAQVFLVLRILRLLRLFRIFKMMRYVSEAETLKRALGLSRPKITVFLLTVLSIVVVIGAAMSLVERNTPGFESIPSSMYWTVITMTTVGYGDVVPLTATGKVLASILTIMGYGIIAVPTGIVSAELIRASGQTSITTQACPSCARSGHDPDAQYCKFCGDLL